MILTPPFSTCPDCSYPLTGLPTVHRCPECGFAFDDLTVLVRPARLWRPYLVTLSVELLVAFWFGGNVTQLLASIMGGRAAGLLVILLCVAMIVVTVVIIHRANRRGRFAAVNREGITIRNSGDSVRIPWSDLGLVSFRDISPWVQRRAAIGSISLRGLFDSKAELECFEEIVDYLRANAGRKDQVHNDRDAEIHGILESHGGTAGSTRTSMPPKPSRRLFRIGGALIAVSMLAILPIAMLGDQWLFLVFPADAVFIAGVAYCVKGVWSDEAKGVPRKRYPPLVRRGLILAGCGILAVITAAALDTRQWIVIVPGEICLWAGLILFCVGMWRSDKSR